MVPSEVDIHSAEGLARLFRFGVGKREDEADRSALARLEERLRLPPYSPRTRGALEDAVAHLDQLDHDARFEWACDRIAAVMDAAQQPDHEMMEYLLRVSSQHDVVRFSFSRAVLLCLRHANAVRKKQSRPFDDHAVRYAGIGADVPLMAMTALFLNLPIYTEANPPWDPDGLLDAEPDVTPPDIEITFPPSNFRLEHAPHLETSVRKSRIPRAVDRGKFDLESVMLDYLSDTNLPAFAITSGTFVTSTNQSRLKARQHLLKGRRIRRVAELTTGLRPKVLVETCASDEFPETVRMVSTDSFDIFAMSGPDSPQIRGKSEQITVEEILTSGSSLAPGRYLAKGPTGGKGLKAVFLSMRTPSKYQLSDLFEVIRPKATKQNSVGGLNITEVRPSDLSEHGHLLDTFNYIAVRASLGDNLKDQKLKAGDIVFAHRGPCGRVGYVTQDDIERAKASAEKIARNDDEEGNKPEGGIWASQALFIFRARRRTSGRTRRDYCDPRVLFMYLMTEKVRDNWRSLTIGDRSPSLPIGEVERFAIPENLVSDGKPPNGTKPSGKTDDHVSKVLDAFENRQAKAKLISDIEKEMNEDLQKVWDVSWSSD